MSLNMLSKCILMPLHKQTHTTKRVKKYAIFELIIAFVEATSLSKIAYTYIYDI